ncbi:MAG: ABC-F family ATP-binding cassette domain-containing protein, partial [Actinomycetota bacterium]
RYRCDTGAGPGRRRTSGDGRPHGTMIAISNLWKAYGHQDLFKGADLRVVPGDRLAIVGPNGTGKTTLFEMLAGAVTPDQGEIRLEKGISIGYLRQETDTLRGRSLLEEVVSGVEEAARASARLRALEAELAATVPGDEHDRLLAEYGHLEARFSHLGGYTLESEAKRVLAGLGFKQTDFGRPTEGFSGGWLMRIALAKLLLAVPDLLMLDEPTNHLDLEAVEWLEKFLRLYRGAVLFVSHDREFINEIATKVVEIDRARLVSYTGNYEGFVRQREAAARQLEAAERNRAKQTAATQEFIDRFRYKASKARQVQSRIKQLEREQADAGPGLRTTQKTMGLRFPPTPRTGRVVLECAGVRFAYGDTLVYDSLDFVLERGHKVALVGPNGAGKTTLLKLLAGVLEPQAGRRTLGQNVELGYFAQHQIEALNPQNRVIDEMVRAMPPGADVNPRGLLGRFLFSGDTVEKRVSVLSGGERTRLAMARLLVSPFSVLCLDEPTNHLDITSRDVLEDALVEYGGALVLITHDRHLISSVANRIVEVVDGRLTTYQGDYDYYLSKRDGQATVLREPDRVRRPDRPRPPRAQPNNLKRLRDSVARIEREMVAVEADIGRIANRLADPVVYAVGGDEVADLSREYEVKTRRLQELESAWEEAAGLLEAQEAAPGG